MPRSVADLLREATDRLRASGSESARLDAELLLGYALGLDRTRVLAHPEAPVSDGQAALVETLVARRETGEPVAYIRGIKEFHGLAFMVDERVLIPRPDTERLVELALERVARPTGRGGTAGRLAALHASGTWAPAAAPSASAWRWRCGRVATCRTCGCWPATSRRGHSGRPSRMPSRTTSRTSSSCAPAVCWTSSRRWARSTCWSPTCPTSRRRVLATLPIAVTFEPRVALDGGPDGLDAHPAAAGRSARRAGTGRPGTARDRLGPGRRRSARR